MNKNSRTKKCDDTAYNYAPKNWDIYGEISEAKSPNYMGDGCCGNDMPNESQYADYYSTPMTGGYAPAPQLYNAMPYNEPPYNGGPSYPEPPYNGQERACGIQHTAEFLCSQVGKLVRVEFLVGGRTCDKVGRLVEVGASYILLQTIDPYSTMMCDLDSIKFVTIVNAPPSAGVVIMP